MNNTLIEKTINISTLNRQRKITIFLPYDYYQSTKEYPVMYMHDGQNLFFDELSYSGHSWGIKRNYNSENQPQVIIVGIDNGGEHRFKEYSPYTTSPYAKQLISNSYEITGFNGEGNHYIDWIVNELKPYIDTNYRAKKDFDNTILVGSSMGGLISTYGGLLYHKIFGRLGVFSPAFWYCREEMFNYTKNINVYNGKIFISVGTNEHGVASPQDYINDTKEMIKILNSKNVNNKSIFVDGGEHNELLWESLLSEMNNYFFEQYGINLNNIEYKKKTPA